MHTRRELSGSDARVGRGYELAAAEKARELDALNWFKSFGVISIAGGYAEPGRLNALLHEALAPADRELETA